MVSGGLATVASASTTTEAVSCAGGRHHAVQLGDNDNGRRIRICRGTRVDVVLHAPTSSTPDTWWKPITSDSRALRAIPQNRLPVRGVTLGSFTGVHHGSANLLSTRAACPANPGGPRCHAIQGWHVTVNID